MTIQARRDVFQAIADPTRRAIISLIAAKELNLNAIADHFEISRPAISQHIKILTECGIVTMQQQGRERFCQIEISALHEVSDWTQGLIELWEHRFQKLDALLIELQKKEKKIEKPKERPTKRTSSTKR